MMRTRPFRRAALAAAAGALVVASMSGLGPIPGGASSHREAPLITDDPKADNTDVYAFVSPDDPDSVTIIGSWIPLEEPAGGPNFYPWAVGGAAYDFNIDNDGDAKADIVYRWTFTDHRRSTDTFLYNTGPVTSLHDPDLNFFQTYNLQRIAVGGRTRTLVRNGHAVPSFVGDPSMPDYEALFEEGITSGSWGKSWAGQSDDPFFLDLRVFDLLYGGDLSEVGDDTLQGFGVNTIALQVHKRDLAEDGDEEENPIIGVWSTTSRPSTRVLMDDGTQGISGDLVQVSRLGMPLVNEVVIPVGLKDRFNASLPEDDGQFLEFVTEPELPELIEAIFGIPAPATPRDDLVAVFLTGVEGLNQPAGVTPSEQLRLNMSIPPCEPDTCGEYSPLGVIGGDLAGYPNGRRLADDVIDISLQVVEGELVGNPNDLGDGVDQNDVPFRDAFPYVALPVSGSEASPH